MMDIRKYISRFDGNQNVYVTLDPLLLPEMENIQSSLISYGKIKKLFTYTRLNDLRNYGPLVFSVADTCVLNVLNEYSATNLGVYFITKADLNTLVSHLQSLMFLTDISGEKVLLRLYDPIPMEYILHYYITRKFKLFDTVAQVFGVGANSKLYVAEENNGHYRFLTNAKIHTV